MNTLPLSTPLCEGCKVEDAIKYLRQRLSPKFGRGESNAIISLLFEDLKGWSATDMIIYGERELSGYICSKLLEAANRLEKYEPIQYITGKAHFYGMVFDVNRDVLIPRPETAELVDIIVKENPLPDLHVLDVATGSGCIAIALYRNLLFPQIDALDISEDAIEVARRNATKLKAKIRFECQDILSWKAPEDNYDIIVSNPPYIAQSEELGMEKNVLLYEPHSALFVPDSDPLIFYKTIARKGQTALHQGGRLYFEINPLYADSLKDMLLSYGYTDIEIARDIHGKSRFAKAIKAS